MNVVLGALQLMLVSGSRGQCHGGVVVLLVVPLLATQMGLCLFAAFARAGRDHRDPRAARWSLALTLLGLSLAGAAVLTLLANEGV